MIPKKIHYCWLSEDAMPASFMYNIESWRKNLPDYEFVKWDRKRFPLEKNIWVRQAFERKKYAFAADYIRLYALATEGGIYLDCDVEVLKSFNDLLHLPYFICRENSPQGIEAAVMGAEKGIPWIMQSLDYYHGRKFVNEDGVKQTVVLPSVLTHVISAHYRLSYVNGISEFEDSPECVSVLPCDFFCPKNYVTKKISITKNTYCIHHFAGSWQPAWKKILLYLWLPLSTKYPVLKSFIKH